MIQNPKAVHPGVTLLNDFMEPAHLSATRLSTIIGIHANIITDIIDEKSNITPDIACSLAKHFDVSAKFWLNLQNQYDYR